MTPFAFIEGLMIGGGLIIAIGAQNAYVIRQGIKGEHVFAIAAVCSAVDIALIALGAGGVGTLIAQSPTLQAIAAWGGAAFLFVYGGLALRKAFDIRPGMWDLADKSAEALASSGRSLKKVITTAHAFSLLNPHVYLDTVVMLGGVAAQHEPDARIVFALGAMAASVVWFFALGYGATRLAPFFRTVVGARLLELTICAVMWIVAAKLVIRELGS